MLGYLLIVFNQKPQENESQDGSRKVPLTSAERVRAFRERQKLLAAEQPSTTDDNRTPQDKPRKVPRTSAERVRAYRERQRLLAAEQPSTSGNNRPRKNRPQGKPRKVPLTPAERVRAYRQRKKLHLGSMVPSLRYHNCPLCTYVTTLKFRMDGHKIIHNFPKTQSFFSCANAIEPLRCFQCIRFETHNLVDLKRHFKAKKSLHACEHCPYTTRRKRVLARHVSTEHADLVRWYECEHCSYKTKTEAYLRRHEKFMHGSRAKLRCDRCGYETRYKQRLQSHVLVKHGDPGKVQWFKCERCSYKCRTKTLLKRHADVHERKLKCDQCPVELTKRNLKNHVLCKHAKPEDVKWFQCEHCWYKCKVQRYLNYHMDKEHGKDDDLVHDNLKCGQCQFETKYKYNLRKHILWTHSNSGMKDKTVQGVMKMDDNAFKFICDQCGWTGRFKQSVDRHLLRKHTDRDDKEWFRCALCSYRSEIRGDIRKHMNNMHSASRFVCDQCGFETKFRTNLDKHVSRMHANRDGVEWFRCTRCSYKSKIKGDVKRHVKNTHENASKFKCDECAFETKFKYNLGMHVSRKHRR